MDERVETNFMNSDTENLLQKFEKNLILKEDLSKYNWFNLGGPADIFFKPENKEQLKNFLKEVEQKNYRIYILGAGSNTLIRDSGIKGIVIKLGSKFSEIKLLEKDTIEVGAGILDRKVADFAQNNCISNLEFLSCIPGSIGGAVIMNSGCYGTDISKILLSIKVIDEKGEEKEIPNKDINFCYRGSAIPKNYIILSAILKGSNSPKNSIEKKQRELIQRKKDSQPSQVKTGGSTFKNDNTKKAWQLIKESGCEKFSVGDAKISEKHCNFFINKGNAKSRDLENLILKVKNKVFKETGINLELELHIIGENI